MNAKKDTQQQSIQENPWNVYLSGEIHSDWREQIKEVLNTYQVPIQFPNRTQVIATVTTAGVFYSAVKVIAFGMTIRVQG